MPGWHRRGWADCVAFAAERAISRGVAPSRRLIQFAMWLGCANPASSATWLMLSRPSSSSAFARSTRRCTTY
ncbi:hypothetical protein WK68_24780 [Burkholderia ubonensis]|nr:hypothetical protein WK68_24780 [Burkholderia ubonensis]